MKKMLCKIMAAALVLTSVGSFNVLNASAATTTDVIWETKHTLNFDGLTEIANTSTEIYGANASLSESGRTGNALKLTTETANVDTDGKFGLKLSAFADSESADEVKLEYFVKFSDPASGTATQTGFASFNSLQAKLKNSTGGRGWALRLRNNRYACFTNAEVTGTALIDGWYKVTYEFKHSTDTATVTITDPEGNKISQSATVNGIQAYLFGCDAYTGELLFDDISVSYGTYNVIETAEDFSLDFDDLTPESNFTDEKITQANINAVVKNTEADGNFLRLSCADSASATKNTFQIKAYENAETADVVTLEYDARLPKAADGAADGWATMPSLNTKYKGFNGVNTWGARVRGNLTQANLNAVRDTVNIGTDWFSVLHVLDKSEGTITTTVTAKDGTSHTNTAKYAPATISYYELVADDTTILDYVDVDNINIMFTYEGPKASVEIYEDETVQDTAEVSPAANKIVVTFDRDVKESTISQDTVMLLDSDGKELAYNGSFLDNVYTMVPNATFDAGKSYQVYVDGVESIYGAAMESPVTLDFTIAGEAALDKTESAKSFEITFDDISSIADLENAEAVIATTDPVTSDEISLVPDTNGGNYLKITAGRALRITGFENIKTADRVILEYDGMLSDTTTSGIGGTFMAPTGGNNSHGMRVAWDRAMYPGNTTSVSHTAVADAWYHVKMDFDPKTGLISSEVTVPEGATEVPAKTDEQESGTAIKDGLFAFDLHRNARSSTAYYDNFKVTFVYNTPEVTADDVTFVTAEGEAIKDLTKVPSTATAVKVDFGTTIDTTTLTEDNVYITKKDDTTKLNYYPTYSGTVLKLSFADSLNLKTDYVLNISGVKNLAGEEIEVTAIPFTTGEGEVKATLAGLKSSTGVAITNIEALKTVKTATIEIDYKNSTQEAQTINVIVAYYSGNQLKKAELVKTENVLANVTAMTYKYELTAPDLTDVTEVKVMSWNAFSSMRPMSESITLQ